MEAEDCGENMLCCAPHLNRTCTLAAIRGVGDPGLGSLGLQSFQIARCWAGRWAPLVGLAGFCCERDQETENVVVQDELLVNRKE